MRKFLRLASLPARPRAGRGGGRAGADQAQPDAPERQPRIAAGQDRRRRRGRDRARHALLVRPGDDRGAAEEPQGARHRLAGDHAVAGRRRSPRTAALRRHARLCAGRRPARGRPVAGLARRAAGEVGRPAGLLARRRAGRGDRAPAAQRAQGRADGARLRDRARAGRGLPARVRPSAAARDRRGAQESARHAHGRLPELQAGAGAERDLPRRLCRAAATARGTHRQADAGDRRRQGRGRARSRRASCRPT